MVSEILTIEELGQWLKLSRSQIYSLTRKRAKSRMQNPVPKIVLNGNIRFRRADIEAWLERVAKEEQ